MKSISVFGFQFNDSRKSYLMLAFLCVSTSLVSSALQEHVFRTQGFQFPDSVTFLTVLLYFTFGAVEMKITGCTNYYLVSLLFFWATEILVLSMLLDFGDVIKACLSPSSIGSGVRI
jgi:hypothetical protein